MGIFAKGMVKTTKINSTSLSIDKRKHKLQSCSIRYGYKLDDPICVGHGNMKKKKKKCQTAECGTIAVVTICITQTMVISLLDRTGVLVAERRLTGRACGISSRLFAVANGTE